MAHSRNFRLAISRIVLLLSITVPGAFAQFKPYWRTGSIEGGPFVGASYGIVNAQYMVGGNLTIAASQTFLPYVEYTYLPQVARPTAISTLGTGSTATADRNISFSDFHGGVHINLPVHEKHVVPYLAGGIGALIHSQQDVIVTIRNADGTTNKISTRQPSGADLAVNGGGGIRFYFNQRFGTRVEAKVYKPTGEFSSVFGKVEAGIFYQFR